MTPVIETRPRPSARWAIASLALTMLVASLGISIATVALPTLSKVFAAPLAAVQWIILAYLLAITVTIVPMGRLGDTVGRRRVLLAGILLFTLASLLCGLAPSLGVLIAARGLQGLGAAILMALALSAVRETVPAGKTGSAMGLLGTMSALGTALGPSLGGPLIAELSWRSVFLVLVPLGVLTFALAVRHLPESEKARQHRKGRIDLPGILILGLTLSAYALAMTAEGGNFTRVNGLFLAGALLGIGFFVRIEAKAASPLIDITAFRDMSFSAALVMNLLVSIVMMATLVVGPFFLAFGLGLNEAVLGLVMAVGPTVSALTGVPAGRITDRFGAPAAVIVGLMQMAIGTFALALLPWLYGLAGYVVALVLLTPGYQLFLAALNTGVLMDVTADRRGAVSGILSLSHNLGFITGASVMGALFAAAVGESDMAGASSDAVIFGLIATFAAGGGLVLIAIGIAFASR